MEPLTTAMTLKTAVMCLQTIVLTIGCAWLVKTLRDERLKVQRENQRKREQLERLHRAMTEEHEAMLNDLVRQAHDIVQSRFGDQSDGS